MNRIGERIKRRREVLKLQLNDLAHKVGISPSALSQIEKSKSFPSIITLKSISENLHTTVGELIGENESLINNPVVSEEDIKYIDKNASGTSIYVLSHHDTNKQMDTYLVKFKPGSEIGGLFGSSYSQVFGHLISGEVKFTINDKDYILKKGDNIYFNAKTPYSLVGSEKEESELIWIQSPPNY
jgi:transcriptional regulator with XRE-family HTH domain